MTEPVATVCLIASDGVQVKVSEPAARLSETISHILDASNTALPHISVKSGDITEITFSKISSPVLTKVAEYMEYKLKHQGSTKDVPEFSFEDDIAVELYIVSGFLKI